MPLRFVLDEHLRGGGLWHAIQRHNAAGLSLIDALRVGDVPDLPLGASDTDLLQWAEANSRIVLTRDANTLPDTLKSHLQAGYASPGIVLLRKKTSIAA